MTMVNIFFKLPKNYPATISQIEEAIRNGVHEEYFDFEDIEEIMQFNSDFLVGIKGGDGFRIYAYISFVEHIVEIVEKAIGAKLLLVW